MFQTLRGYPQAVNIQTKVTIAVSAVSCQIEISVVVVAKPCQ